LFGCSSWSASVIPFADMTQLSLPICTHPNNFLYQIHACTFASDVCTLNGILKYDVTVIEKLTCIKSSFKSCVVTLRKIMFSGDMQHAYQKKVVHF
jgi:hypothetical protein